MKRPTPQRKPTPTPQGCWRFRLVGIGGDWTGVTVTRVAGPTWFYARVHALGVLKADQRGARVVHEPCPVQEADWVLSWSGHAAGSSPTLVLIATQVGT